VFDIFGRNITHKVNNKKALYYITSNNLCFCTTWQNGETRKLHFSLKCQNLTSRCLISSIFFDWWLILTLPYDSLNLVINTFRSGLLWGHGSGEKKLRALQQLDCVAHTMH